MARLRPRSRSVQQDNRLSTLPEKLVRLTPLSTAVPARRRARVARELPAYDFRVSDLLPPEYDRTVALRRRNLPRDAALARVLDALMASCEASTMRAFVDGVTGFLDADGCATRRSVKTLRLEFFQTQGGADVADRLIADAVGSWGVEDLEAVVRPASHAPAPAYSFPDHGRRGSRLRSLTLGNCTVPPRLLHRYGALTKLVLRDMPDSTPAGVYERVLRECTRLQVLHLTSCGCAEGRLVVHSQVITELVVEACSFTAIELRDLPMLARLACLTNPVELVFGSVPSLTHTNLTFSLKEEDDAFVLPPPPQLQLDHFLGHGTSPTSMENLIIQFTGPKRWIGSHDLNKPLLHLKRLLIADLPSNWDVSWTRTLLMDAPSLEVLHIHVAHSDEVPESFGIIWYTTTHHPHIKELVLSGFTLTRPQMELLKYLLSMCTSLRRLVLLKDGHVQYNGLWDWDMVGGCQEECPWREHDKKAVRRMIKFGARPLVQLIMA